jgi:hypothetical protein
MTDDKFSHGWLLGHTPGYDLNIPSTNTAGLYFHERFSGTRCGNRPISHPDIIEVKKNCRSHRLRYIHVSFPFTFSRRKEVLVFQLNKISHLDGIPNRSLPFFRYGKQGQTWIPAMKTTQFHGIFNTGNTKTSGYRFVETKEPVVQFTSTGYVTGLVFFV